MTEVEQEPETYRKENGAAAQPWLRVISCCFVDRIGCAPDHGSKSFVLFRGSYDCAPKPLIHEMTRILTKLQT